MNNIDQLISTIISASGNDNSVYADLKYGYNKNFESRVWKYITPYCNLEDERQRIIWTFIASTVGILAKDKLIYDHAGNMGATIRHIAFGLNGEKGLTTFERRFESIIECKTVEKLCACLVPIIKTASSKGISVDVVSLFWDLQKWDSKINPSVKVQWAKSYLSK